MSCPHRERCTVCGREHNWFASYCSEGCRGELEERARIVAWLRATGAVNGDSLADALEAHLDAPAGKGHGAE